MNACQLYAFTFLFTYFIIIKQTKIMKFQYVSTNQQLLFHYLFHFLF